MTHSSGVFQLHRFNVAKFNAFLKRKGVWFWCGRVLSTLSLTVELVQFVRGMSICYGD